MPKISTDNYDTVASWNGSQDLFVVEQPDGTKVATPAMVKQYVLGNSIDDIYSVMGQNGAKNLIPYPYYRSSGYVHRSVTYTVDNNGKITANGTATGGNSYFEMRNAAYETFNLKPNTRYIISGCPSGGGDSTYSLAVSYNVGGGSSTTLASDFGNGAEFTTPQNANANYTISVKIISGTATTNLLFEPMLRLATDTDDTYQPYAKTNKELTEAIGDLSQTGLTGDSVAEQLETASGQIADRAIIIKATSSDTKNFSIPKSIWTTHGFGSGSNHTALFCGGYAGRISAGLLGVSRDGVSVIKLGDNTVTASISGDNIIIAFSDTVYTDLRLVLFN